MFCASPGEARPFLSGDGGGVEGKGSKLEMRHWCGQEKRREGKLCLECKIIERILFKYNKISKEKEGKLKKEKKIQVCYI